MIMRSFMYNLRLWYKLNRDNVITILCGIGVCIAIAVAFKLAQIMQP